MGFGAILAYNPLVFNFDVGAIWRRTPLIYVTILATLCIKGLNSVTPPRAAAPHSGVMQND